MTTDVKNRTQQAHATLTIPGMGSDHCAGIVRTSLERLDGVQDIQTSIAAHRARVSYDADRLSAADLKAAVEKAGYEVDDGEGADGPRELRLTVPGMGSDHCAGIVADSVRRLPGIAKLDTNIGNHRVRVSFDAGKTDAQAIRAAIERAGYEVDALDESQAPDHDSDAASEDRYLARAWKRLWIAAIPTTLIMVLMGPHMFWQPIPGYLAIVAVLAFPVVFLFGGWATHVSAWRSLTNRTANMDVLISMGSLPPYLIGLLGFIYPMTSFIEMAATIMTFHLIGRYLEARAKGRASQAIKRLITMGAKTATVLRDGAEAEVPVAELQPGDIMLVRPGAKVPTDGEIVDGNSHLDESIATGESVPVEKGPGDAVIGATINKEGVLKVRATRVGADTFLSQVIKLVEEAQGSKVPIQEFADRLTGYFVPGVLVIALGTFVTWLAFADIFQPILHWGAGFLPWVNPDISPLMGATLAMIAVLVIACPCALGLATPTALTDAVALEGFDEDAVLRAAAAVEAGSEHPLAQAIVTGARERGLAVPEVTKFKSLTARGVQGELDGETVRVGSRRLLIEAGISLGDLEERLVALETEGKTAMLVAIGERAAGLVAVADTIKEDSKAAIAEMHALGIHVVMVTGDNERTARHVARQVGLDEVMAGGLPEGKVEAIRELQDKHGQHVAMVGDGINDAPALKQANVGIAIGAGADVAIEAADVTLVTGELTRVVEAIRLSKSTFRKIVENLFWAWAYNLAAIPVAAVGLLHPMVGVIAMTASSLSVIGNSLLLKRAKLEVRK